MSKDNIVSLLMPGGIEDSLTELLRNGARRLIQQAIEAELATAFHRFEMSGFQRNAAWLPRP